MPKIKNAKTKTARTSVAATAKPTPTVARKPGPKLSPSLAPATTKRSRKPNGGTKIAAPFPMPGGTVPGAGLGATPPDTTSAVPTALGKQAQVVALLRRPEGASIADLMRATGWLPHSVRGLISAVVKRKLGLAVVSAVEPERGRVYRIEPPAGADLVLLPVPVVPPAASPALKLRQARKVRRAEASRAGEASRGA